MMMLGGGTATMTATLQIYNYAMVDHMMGYASAYAWIVFFDGSRRDVCVFPFRRRESLLCGR